MIDALPRSFGCGYNMPRVEAYRGYRSPRSKFRLPNSPNRLLALLFSFLSLHAPRLSSPLTLLFFSGPDTNFDIVSRCFESARSFPPRLCVCIYIRRVYMYRTLYEEHEEFLLSIFISGRTHWAAYQTRGHLQPHDHVPSISREPPPY